MRQGLAAAGLIVAGIAGPAHTAEQAPALEALQEEIGEVVQNAVEEARRGGGTVDQKAVRESVGTAVQGATDRALDDAFRQDQKPPTPAEIALGLLSGTLKQAAGGVAAGGAGQSRTDAQTALGLLTGTLTATDDPASDNIIVKPNNTATTLTPSAGGAGGSGGGAAAGALAATTSQGAPRAQGGVALADGERSMSDEQARGLNAVLNPQQSTDAPADAATTQAAIDGNPLLSAAQAEGMDVTQHAQNEIAGGNASGAPVLTGFTVKWSENFQDGTGKLSRVWGPGVDTSVQGQLTIRDGEGSGAMVPRTEQNAGSGRGTDAGFGYGLFSFTLAMNGSGSPGSAALLWPCGSGENAHAVTAYDDVNTSEQHTYSLLWTPGEIRRLVDGRQIGEPVKENVPTDAANGGENLCPGVATQAGESGFVVFGVTYAVPDFGEGGSRGTTTAPVTAERGSGPSQSSGGGPGQTATLTRRPVASAGPCSVESAQRTGVFVGHEASKVGEFENAVGAQAGSVLAYTSGQDWDTPNPEWQLSGEFLGGAGRLINWSIPMTPDNGGVEAMREAAAGKQNERYAGWARSILGSRQGDNGPIYVRTAWELGGEWFPWTQAAQEDPEAFKGAFQQFSKAFRSVSNRFQMVWDFNSDRGPVEQWYPGDEAVQVIAQDIYWTKDFQGNDPVAAFEKSVNGYSRGLAWMAAFAAEHGKRMAIPEWGAPMDAGQDAATWIGLMHDWMNKNNVAYANFWNDGHGSGYDGGKMSDGGNADAAAALQSLFTACAGK